MSNLVSLTLVISDALIFVLGRSIVRENQSLLFKAIFINVAFYVIVMLMYGLGLISFIGELILQQYWYDELFLNCFHYFIGLSMLKIVLYERIFVQNISTYFYLSIVFLVCFGSAFWVFDIGNLLDQVNYIFILFTFMMYIFLIWEVKKSAKNREKRATTPTT
jgi:hypothetical protein